MKKLSLIVVAWVSMIGLSACQPLSPQGPSSTQQALVGMAETDLLACAEPPLRRVVQGGNTVLAYAQRAGALDRTFAGSKGSISDIQYGCEADIAVQGGGVTNLPYHPYPEGSGGATVVRPS